MRKNKAQNFRKQQLKSRSDTTNVFYCLWVRELGKPFWLAEVVERRWPRKMAFLPKYGPALTQSWYSVLHVA